MMTAQRRGRPGDDNKDEDQTRRKRAGGIRGMRMRR